MFPFFLAGLFLEDDQTTERPLGSTDCGEESQTKTPVGSKGMILQGGEADFAKENNSFGPLFVLHGVDALLGRSGVGGKAARAVGLHGKKRQPEPIIWPTF